MSDGPEEPICPQCGAHPGVHPACTLCGGGLKLANRPSSVEEPGERGRPNEWESRPAPVPLGRPIRRHYGRWLMAVVLLVAAFTYLAVRRDVTYYKVTSGSMKPTLAVGERVTVDPSLRTPKIGDVVAFHPPAGADPTVPVCGEIGQGQHYLQPCGMGTAQESKAVLTKRVVAGPGDTVALANGQVVRDGVLQSEPYIEPCGADPSCDFPRSVRVPPGDYYMLGDNRGISDDSRYWGPVPSEWIIGTVVRCSWLTVVCHPMR